jgi:hypothetical protein
VKGLMMAIWISADKQKLTITLQCSTKEELSKLLDEYEEIKRVIKDN